MMMEMTHWTNLAESAENLCSSIRPTQQYCDLLSLQGMVHKFIKADNTVAALYIFNNIYVKSLQ
jgi:hypothetical protein